MEISTPPGKNHVSRGLAVKIIVHRLLFTSMLCGVFWEKTFEKGYRNVIFSLRYGSIEAIEDQLYMNVSFGLQ